MKLHQVKVVGVHPGQTLFNPRDDILTREDVWAPLAPWRWESAHEAAAFTRQIILGAAA